jgi:RimJ/RimL family protein N-acetyltransferase
MEPRRYTLKDGRLVWIREATVEDAAALLQYVHAVSGESDYLTFGLGEFEYTLEQEEAFIRQCRAADNQLFILGSLDEAIVALLSFAGGHRPRIRHSGEFSLSVRKELWGQGIGSAMMDALIDWAVAGQIVTKINLRVRTDNQRAMRLYMAKGFVTEGTIRKAILLAGRYYDHYWMGLEL